MNKNLIIIGAGPGLSLGVALKFGKQGFNLGLISRNSEKLVALQEELKAAGITAYYATADVADPKQLESALSKLKDYLGSIDVLMYNAVDARMKNILEENVDELTHGFRISVANVLTAVRYILHDLKSNKGAVLLTGGGTATYPNPAMGTISLGKAGIRNLAYQLHAVLKPEGVYVGTLTIGGWIHGGSETHSPEILAEKFWEMYTSKSEVEQVY